MFDSELPTENKKIDTFDFNWVNWGNLLGILLFEALSLDHILAPRFCLKQLFIRIIDEFIKL